MTMKSAMIMIVLVVLSVRRSAGSARSRSCRKENVPCSSNCCDGLKCTVVESPPMRCMKVKRDVTAEQEDFQEAVMSLIQGALDGEW